MAQQQKLKEFKYFGFNIKIQPNERNNNSVYKQVIKDLFTKDIIAQVGGEKAVTLRTQFSTEIPLKSKTETVYYGKITRYTTLDGKNWYDKTKKDFVNFEIPLDLFPNGFETDYVFIPAAHRFYIRVNAKVGVNAVQKYLLLALPQVLQSPETFTVNIIQSQDVIEKILQSKELDSLKVALTYTNDDIGDEAQQLMDDLLKDGNIGEFIGAFKPDNTGNLNTNSQFIRGVLELAKENGVAEAVIRDDNGRKQKIITDVYPEKIVIKSEEDQTSIIDLCISILKNYRNE